LTIEEALKRYWGYESFLPLQREAMSCAVSKRDSLVVLPTGGGKSLCFQAPALTLPGMAVVVSPLISLMKDQVDALTECGAPAARVDSSQSPEERRQVRERVRAGSVKALYMSPERLLSERVIAYLRSRELSFIAVDEAHCVSMWGHDFRPEYRELGRLKEAFPGVAVHAFTATATPHVRDDIVEQLRLDSPEVLVGSFDRPNLIYKAERRTDRLRQVRDVLDRHKGESGIVYCIRRADVDGLCAQLRDAGYKALPYHAGMADADRKRNQDAFAKEGADTIVATVAFGMGIDKSNVRYVVHTGMPKSLEHYQQESGRAGRDGLEAECCLFHSGGDYGVWNSILHNMPFEAREIALSKLNDMYGYCTGLACRHRALVNYFGQDLGKDNCGACDVCLGDVRGMEAAAETARTILSCILELRERFGGGYVASVLVGSREERVLDNSHDDIAAHGALSDYSKRAVRDWIEQLAGQGYLEKTPEFSVLKIADKGRDALRGEDAPRLLKPPKKGARKPKPAKARRRARVAQESWEGVDEGLFELLRDLRKEVAGRKHVPAYVVFTDAALRDMARRRPSTPEGFLAVSGVGERKRRRYGEEFLEAIREYCVENMVYMDAAQE